ncbi:MAG: 4Fe-4S binding protein [Clostridia bacterium]|nr:4Fe-4S binding protein [Clostridia bacterium]
MMDEKTEKTPVTEATEKKEPQKRKISFKERLKSLIPTRRRIIQLYFALLFNAHIKGYITSDLNQNIYKGGSKYLCIPSLNCYSCPGAVGSCPIGSLQNAFSSATHTTPYYVIGIILLFGIFLGRFICGFLCPFGLVQDLLFKIKTPKAKKSRFTRILSYFKYVVLVLFVVIIPLMYAFRNAPLPAFCKYICPAGTLGGAVGLLSNGINNSLFSSLGPLFTWKFVLMISILVGCVFVFRMFCRFICPLGAIYGLFNKFSVVGIKLDKSKCVDCGLCISKCKMDIRHVNDQECINCGDCIEVCPTKAISWKGSKIFLPPNDIGNAGDEAVEAQNKKIKKRNRIIKIVVASVMALVLAFSLVYYNFIYEPEVAIVGSEVGNMCPSFDLETFDENGLDGGVIDPSKNSGKITVVNFWGTWCSGCVKELPYFDQIATEYKDSVTVIAIHTDYMFDTASDYVRELYPDSDMVFAKDYFIENSYDEQYFKMMGGGSNYPITIILDENGIIVNSFLRDVHYDELKEAIEAQLN